LTLDRVWAVVIFVSAVVTASVARIGTVDLAYHIRAGNDIIDAGSLPGIDTYTFSAAGASWVDQQWGAQLWLALVHRIDSWTGVALLLGGLAGATYGFLWLACRARGATPRAASLLAMASLVVGFTNLSMRPQTFAFPLFTASLWIIAGRRQHPGRLGFLPPIAAVWANLHGSFVLAPLLAGLTWLEDRRDRRHIARSRLVIAVATLAATFVNPFGLGAWGYAIGLMTNGRILGDVSEWAAPSARSISGALFFFSALLVACYLARRREPTDLTHLAWLGTFFVLGLATGRAVIWWGFVAPVVVAGILPRRKDTRDQGSPVANRVLLAVLCALLALSLPWWRDGVDPSTGASQLLDEAPQNLVDATMEELPAGSRLFVAQQWASWFEFALPSMPVFVDSRIELFAEATWKDYLELMDGRDGWNSILSKWSVDAVVLQRTDTFLFPRIQRDAAWRLAYGDQMGALFVRA
jgi:hypothetical protein